MPKVSANTTSKKRTRSSSEPPVIEKVEPQVISQVTTEKQGKSKKATSNSTDGKKIKKKTSPTESRVIYLGHIPHGFSEPDMKKFFSQFGEVKNLKLFRSKKTNRSKGYAFLEFEDSSVAEVVATAMNGYMMFERSLVSHVVPPTKLHDGMFKIKSKKTTEPTETIEESTTTEIIDKVLTPEDMGKKIEEAKSKDSKRQKKLSDKGINFTIPTL